MKEVKTKNNILDGSVIENQTFSPTEFIIDK